MPETLDLLLKEPPVRARPRTVHDFTRAARRARDLAGLRTILCEAVRTLGFHHLLLQGPAGEAWLSDMPAGWNAIAATASGAVLAAASQSLAPFLWCEIPRLTGPAPDQHDFLAAAHAAGVGAAVTVPVHRPCTAGEAGSYGVFAGCCTFLTGNGTPLPLGSLAAAHYVGALAFDVAESLHLNRPPARRTEGPQLTPRQRDCVVLVARGKSDWEIGRLLGISECTVHKHVEDAKRRFGVSTRIQLVVQALFDADAVA
ncbi:MAG TPA: helix-turn-helix transcriptional regulator [Rhizomicrobium sp.]|nr:helix-turn-helix transcriptional regulator [Rhizomicrobium sp.]